MGFSSENRLGFFRAFSKYYYTPLFQVSLIGFICFCCPGMFNAVNGLGAGGQVNPQAADNGLTALYASFALFGLLGGGIYNVLGPHKTLFCGCSFFILYMGSFLYYNHHSNQDFIIVAGALQGFGSGLLWAGEGAIMTAYPTDDRKGLYISIFWSIFNLGGVVGGFIPFALNYHTEYGFVNDETYIAFMVVMAFGTLLTLALANPDRVIRDDGSRIITTRYANVWSELWQVFKLLWNWKMLLLAPACVASNFFYTYQFNNVNGLLFNVRTRAFNNVFYWGAQMIGSISIGFILDHSHKSRRIRGFIGIALLIILSVAIWGGGVANQLRYSRNSNLPRMDFKERGYAGPFVLYFCYGLLDAMFQTLCYWTIGALTDDAQMLSRYSGFYKGVQSAGAAVAWHLDNLKESYMKELVVNWALMTVSFPMLLALIILAVRDSEARDPEKSELAKPQTQISPPSSGVAGKGDLESVQEGEKLGNSPDHSAGTAA